jgi:hypothetical protein
MFLGSGQPIIIDNVCAIQFGHDDGPGVPTTSCCSAAGPDSYGSSLFGVITLRHKSTA